MSPCSGLREVIEGRRKEQLLRIKRNLRKMLKQCPNCGHVMKFLDDYNGINCYNCGFWMWYGDEELALSRAVKLKKIDDMVRKFEKEKHK